MTIVDFQLRVKHEGNGTLANWRSATSETLYGEGQTVKAPQGNPGRYPARLLSGGRG